MVGDTRVDVKIDNGKLSFKFPANYTVGSAVPITVVGITNPNKDNDAYIDLLVRDSSSSI